MFILAFLVIILVLVLIHEFGHYFAAKKFGIKVLEFGFGLPPRAWGKKIGETIYSLNWLPIGGFVRLLGEDETDKKLLEDKRSFAYQAVWKRIIVVVAGVVMNLLLAWVLFYIVVIAQNFKVQVPLLTDFKFVGVGQVNETIVVINKVLPNSPAERSGFKVGDRVLAINGEEVKSGEEFIEKTKANLGKEVNFKLADLQNTSQKEVITIPRENPPANEGALGVSLDGMQVANLIYESPFQKAFSGPIHAYNILVYTGATFGKIFSVSQEQKTLEPVAYSVGGPIAIVFTIKEFLNLKSFVPLIDLAANMSLILAFVNVLPIPALDGGRLMFLVIEAVTQKKVPASIEAKIHALGMMVLLGLIVLITYKDIRVYILNLSPF